MFEGTLTDVSEAISQNYVFKNVSVNGTDGWKLWGQSYCHYMVNMLWLVGYL